MAIPRSCGVDALPERTSCGKCESAHTRIRQKGYRCLHPSCAIAFFRSGRGIRPGDSVYAYGFPLQGLLASDPGITAGNVSNLAGIGDDRSLLQITAPIQQGNSGGPLLDETGNVVGVIVGKLNSLVIAKLTGDIPQNVNFAINATEARKFLDIYGIAYRTAPSEQEIDAADIASSARRFTVLVECWR